MSNNTRLGISPLIWTNDDIPDLGGEIPLGICLSEIRETGFTGTELGNIFPHEAEILLPLLEQHGLQLASGWYGTCLLRLSVEDQIQALQSHLYLLKKAGCRVMVIAEVSNTVHSDMNTPLSARCELDDAEWKSYGEKLTAVADYLLEHNMAMAYHPHAGTIVETETDIDRLMMACGPSVGLTLDTGHAILAGDNPAELIHRYGDRIVHIHLKDVRPDILAQARAQDLSFLQSVLNGVFTVPGDGCIDYGAVFSAIKSIDYQGWLLVEAEQDPAKAHPLTYARMAYENTTTYMRHTGLHWR